MTSKEALSKICNHIIKIDNEGFYETDDKHYDIQKLLDNKKIYHVIIEERQYGMKEKTNEN